MRSPFPARTVILAGIATTAAVLANGNAAAQDGFFFRPPAVTLEFRAGRTMQSTRSDIYNFLTTNLTLAKKDFAATSYAVNASIRATDRADIVADVGYANSNAASESRDFIGADDKPIAQQTSLRRTPLSIGARLFPLKRGEAVGRYAWIPSAFTPYIGAGAGMMFYRLAQQGDFVDASDLSVFTDELHSSGNAALLYGEAGATYWLNQRVGVTADARYNWSKAAMRNDFVRFNNIDLRGVQATAGLAVRF